MSSKQVTDRQKSAQAVTASIETHADEVGQAVARRLAPCLERGEKMPDVALLLRLLGRELAARVAAMVAADEAHERELGDDAGPREDRDAAAAKLGARMVELREIITGVYGQATATALGFVERTPQDPVVLVRFAGNVVLAIEDKGFGRARVRGASLDAREIATELKALIAALNGHLADVAREQREAQATLGRRNAAMDSSDASFSDVASVQSVMLRVAGRADLAARVRPSTRNPGRTDEQPEGGGEGDAPDGGGGGGGGGTSGDR
jgi:hypothetical protein